jgi:hypothetical protein
MEGYMETTGLELLRSHARSLEDLIKKMTDDEDVILIDTGWCLGLVAQNILECFEIIASELPETSKPFLANDIHTVAELLERAAFIATESESHIDLLAMSYLIARAYAKTQSIDRKYGQHVIQVLEAESN